MILRVLSITVTFCAVLALWFGYGQLGSLRGTLLWEYRYITYAVAAFLMLSALEWGVGLLKKTFLGEQEGH